MDNKELIDTLNDLIETCKDGEYGFRACAEQASAGELMSVLARQTDDYRHAAAELQECVFQLGGEPDTRGSASGALHRGWVALRSTLSSYNDQALLKECERGADIAVARYAATLEKPLPDGLRTVLERQHQGIRQNRKQIHELLERRLAA